MAKSWVKKVTQVALWFASIGGANILLTSLLNLNLVSSILTSINQAGLESFVNGLVGASGGWLGIQALMGNINVK